MESVVGRTFLPKGQNTVTRCPIVIRLVRDLHFETFYVWNEIDQLRNGFTKEDYEAEEQGLTEKIRTSQAALLVGNSKGLTSKKVFVEIHSPKVVNLTVIDLPGLVVNDPVSGNRTLTG